MMDNVVVGAIWDVLVKYAGAYEPDRNSFVNLILEGCREYRFMGHLGFGGKFRVWPDRAWYVDCYPEDLSAERQAVISETNEALRKLWLAKTS